MMCANQVAYFVLAVMAAAFLTWKWRLCSKEWAASVQICQHMFDLIWLVLIQNTCRCFWVSQFTYIFIHSFPSSGMNIRDFLRHFCALLFQTRFLEYVQKLLKLPALVARPSDVETECLTDPGLSKRGCTKTLILLSFVAGRVPSLPLMDLYYFWEGHYANRLVFGALLSIIRTLFKIGSRDKACFATLSAAGLWLILSRWNIREIFRPVGGKKYTV